MRLLKPGIVLISSCSVTVLRFSLVGVAAAGALLGAALGAAAVTAGALVAAGALVGAAGAGAVTAAGAVVVVAVVVVPPHAASVRASASPVATRQKGVVCTFIGKLLSICSAQRR